MMHVLRMGWVAFLMVATLGLTAISASAATPAKKLFGAKKLPAVMKPAAHGFYSKGCVSGAVAIPKDGPTWQAMRLARNRRWGHPDLINTVIDLSKKANRLGWRGLLVGDISQPRGGPMLTGHASHQIGLDADIWLTEMPDRRLSYKERQYMSATSMLARRGKRIDQTRIGPAFTIGQFNLIRAAAEYPQVERVLVHPTIKRQLCRIEKGDRKWLYKVRPYWGHHYHMHVRLSCPKDSPGCRPQSKPQASDGCGKELADWARLINPPKRKKIKKPVKRKKRKKRRRKPVLTLASLPQACAVVLNASAPANEKSATMGFANGSTQAPVMRAVAAVASPAKTVQAGSMPALQRIPVPTPRPAR